MIDESTETWTPWVSRLTAARQRREDRLAEWQSNVARRTGTTASSTSGATTTKVNQDWPLTKAKIAQLYSQTPQVRLSPKDPAFEPAVPVFAKTLNDAIEEASVGTCVEEVLADVVNAAGIGAALVSCEKLTALKVDPVSGEAIPLPVDSADRVTRISPSDLLVPTDFTGSNYDQARWLAHDGRLTWEQAQRDLHLSPEVKETVITGDARASASKSLSTDADRFRDTEVVNFTELFYWRHYYHADETSFKALQRLVFVQGLEAPVVDEPYRGQYVTEGQVLGVTKNPIRVLTLTYISDESLPPSDSTIGRYDVEQLEAYRTDSEQQRKHSIPIRWYDSNRVGANTKAKLDQGQVQDFIPTNGPGDRALGEVSRASYAQEKFEFEKILKNDLTEQWQVGTNQAGAFATGERSASEARIIQSNFQTRVLQERDKVTKFFVGIAEVMAGHLALYGNVDVSSVIDQQRLETWDQRSIANQFVYTVRADSSVRLDAEQRIEQIMKALNLTAQSGYVNPKDPIAQIWELSGFDPATVVIEPQPKPPEPVKMSVSKAEDIINPIVLAHLFRTGQAPTPEDLAAAVKLLQEAFAGGVPVVPPAPPETGPPGDVQSPGIRHADWQAMPRVEKRAQDAGAPN